MSWINATTDSQHALLCKSIFAAKLRHVMDGDKLTLRVHHEVSFR